jgi:mono/diheme cytochrome c family protein
MRLSVLAVLALVAGIAVPGARPEEPATAGARLFETHCASCHGPGGKGDGPMTDQLRYVPPDLTRIAKRAGGKYPADEVYRIIDGRRPVKGHGGTDMPVWGDAFKASQEGYDEARVRERLTALVRHLETIQEK